jgi:uncharacterized repeat protein (TIGR03803 family)
MNTWSLSRAALSLCIAALFLVACGGSQALVTPALVTSSTRTTHRGPAPSFQVLYSFGSDSDGANPDAGLLNLRGTLYGTTHFGGAYDSGSVYSISTTGTEKVLHSFGSGSDGAIAIAGLLNVKGTLYGTTGGGGASTKGTVYRISTSGTEKVLHSFGSGFDGATPYAGLLDVKGTLYGTTLGGGASAVGTVYRISMTTGKEKVLHSFGSAFDGANPYAALIDVNGTLYGTTYFGGASRRGPAHSVSPTGTVYSISPAGTEKVLHSFGYFFGVPDGDTPAAGLLNVGGTLYGTTYHGGLYGSGTVYSINTTGAEKVLHSFGSGSDGATPIAGLLNVNGTLYGTTYVGGAHGSGTVYSISTTGKEKVLHSFGSGSDGAMPKARLLNVNGTLYGTTYYGGAYGNGTVFLLRP